jgi:hypothetical protein
LNGLAHLASRYSQLSVRHSPAISTDSRHFDFHKSASFRGLSNNKNPKKKIAAPPMSRSEQGSRPWTTVRLGPGPRRGMETCDGSRVVVSRGTARKKEIGRAGLSRFFGLQN